jgi:hypothetical protein
MGFETSTTLVLQSGLAGLCVVAEPLYLLFIDRIDCRRVLYVLSFAITAVLYKLYGMLNPCMSP